MFARLLLTCGLLAALPAVSPAGFVAVSSRAVLAGTDFIDWGTKGGVFTVLPNPFSVTSNGGLTATVSQASGTFERRDQNTGWGGSFNSGDRLLWTRGNNGPITILFATPLTAAGANFQTDFYGGFTARVDALAADGTTVLGSYTFSGTSSSASDGSSPFAGLQATGGDVFYGLRFTGLTATSFPNDFAINQLDLVPGAATNAVPAPAGLVLLGLGLPALGLTRRRAKLA
jgi:hypothetical protein